MKNAKYFWGIALIIAGVLAILNIFHLFDINIFFQGFWALFIIVPCVIGLFTDKDKIGSCVGICLGVLLLLATRSVIDWDMFWKLMLSAIVIAAGIGIIFGKHCWENKSKIEAATISRDGKEIRSYEVAFGKHFIAFDGEKFEGADVRSSFGAVRLDLRNAIIDNNAVIKLDCSFAGMEILVPQNLIVKIAANSAFGGIKDERRTIIEPDAPCIFIIGNVSFAGVEIK